MEKSGGRFGIVMRINRRGFLRNVFRGGGGLAVAALLPGRSGQVEDGGMQEFWAEAGGGHHAIWIFLDGHEVSDDSTMFYGSPDPGIEVEGYVRVFAHDHPQFGPDGKIATKRINGKVKWVFRYSYGSGTAKIGDKYAKSHDPGTLDADPDAHTHKVTGVGFEGGSHTFDITLGEHHTNLLESDVDVHTHMRERFACDVHPR